MNETEQYEPQQSTASEDTFNFENEWDEASIKLSTIFPNKDFELMKKIYIRLGTETNLKNDDLLNAVAQVILNDEQNSIQSESSLGIASEQHTDEPIIPETVKLENNFPKRNEEAIDSNVTLKRELDDETGLLQNDEPLPSTSRGTVSQDSQWREASLKLSQMFSNIDPELIKNIYIRLTNDNNMKNQDFLNAVVQEIVNNNKSSSQFEISSENEQGRKVDTSKATINENEENNEEIKEESNFDVEQFLMILPNAVEYFENSSRKCEYSLLMFELLKNHFRKLRLVTISDEYKRCSFNAIKTFESLSSMRVETKINRAKTNLASENWQVRLEFDYIVNRQAIKEFIREQKESEEIVLQRIKNNRTHLECECCYEEINPSTTIAISCEEGHVFCQSCAIKGTDEVLAKGCHRVKCFQECSSELNLNSLQKILMPDKFKILLAKVQEGEIAAAKIEGLVSCPFCQYASIPHENDKVFTCMNLDCAKKSCRLCQKLDHSPKDCEESEKNKKARLILEEKMTAALIRKCICGKKIIKDGGCNMVTCSCGISLCYFCGKSLQGHSHLRCHSTITKNMDAAAVVYVARKIKDELLKIDPNLKLDVNSILPKIPRSVKITVPTHALKQSSKLPEL